MRNAALFGFLLSATSALALTSGQQPVIFGGAKPVVSTNLTQLTSLPTSLYSYSGWTAGTGTCTTSAGLVVSATGPCFDYNPSSLSAIGLRLEGSRPNVLFPATPGTGWSENAVTLTQNAGVSPDETSDASSIITTATTAFHQTAVAAIVVSASTTYSAEAYVKQDGWAYAYETLTFGGNTYSASFNISFCTQSGFYTGNVSNPAFGSQSGQNGWCHIWIRAPSGASVAATMAVGTLNQAGNYTTGPLGDGTSGILIWGGDLQPGVFGSSHIPTTTGVVTRAADTMTAQGSLAASLASGPWAYKWQSESTGLTSCVTGAAGAFAWPSYGWMASLKAYKPNTPINQVEC